MRLPIPTLQEEAKRYAADVVPALEMRSSVLMILHDEEISKSYAAEETSERRYEIGLLSGFMVTQ